MRESKKGYGCGCVGRSGRSRRSWGKKNHNQNIFYEKIYFQFFLKKGICNANKCGKDHGNAWGLPQLLGNVPVSQSMKYFVLYIGLSVLPVKQTSLLICKLITLFQRSCDDNNDPCRASCWFSASALPAFIRGGSLANISQSHYNSKPFKLFLSLS